MVKTVVERLKEIIAEQGLNEETASIRCGLERSYFRKLFERPDASPRGETMRKISKGLGVSIEEIMGEEPPSTSPPATNDVRRANATLPAFAQLDKDVPVRGTAAGSHLRGAFQLSSDPVDYVRRPASLMNARNVYSLYVEGSSMEPQYWPGDLIFVHPDKPPRMGDAIIVQCRTGNGEDMEATIGVYIRQTAERLVIQKHNPKAEIDILRSTVIAVHKVLTNNEIYGV